MLLVKNLKIKAPLLSVWIRNFWAAIIVLVLLKLTLVGYNIFAPDTIGAQPAYKYLLKSFLIFGSDILGAAILAAAITVLAGPFAVMGKARISTAISIFVQVAHAIFGAVSFASVLYMGGPLNKQSIDLAIMSEPEGHTLADAEIMKSIGDYLTASTILGLLAAGSVAVMAFIFAPKIYVRLKEMRLKIAVGILVLETFITVVCMPFLVSGEIWGIRIFNYGTEKSPLVEFGWSYIKTIQSKWQLDTSLIDDEFNYDFNGMTPGDYKAPAILAYATPKKTNLLMVAMESIGRPYLDWDENPMPFFSGLKKTPGALSFNNHYSTWSLTTKAYFSILCSELPYPHYPSITMINPAIPCESLPEVLHDEGYFNALITSADLAYDRKRRFFKHREFDLFLDMKNMPGREDVWKDPWGLDERLTIKNIFDVIEKHDDKPFFIFYSMVAGHHPFLACEEHEKKPFDDRVKNYLRALSWIDQRIKDIFFELERTGHGDDTLVVIFSDHGDGHGRYVGRNAWQPVIKVPFAMVGPQMGDYAKTTDLVTSHLDISPTILGLLDIPIPCTMKGRNLLHDKDRRISLFGGRPPKWQLGLTDGNWKFIWEDKSIEMLFDLDKDPGEYNNLAESHPDKVRFYKNKVKQWGAFSTNLIENYAEIRARSTCKPKISTF